MSRIAPPAEKIMAVASIYGALVGELPLDPEAPHDPMVVASLIDAAVRIAMTTDTRDMGILLDREMAQAKPKSVEVHVDVDGFVDEPGFPEDGLPLSDVIDLNRRGGKETTVLFTGQPHDPTARQQALNLCPHRYSKAPGHDWVPCMLEDGHEGEHLWKGVDVAGQ